MFICSLKYFWNLCASSSGTAVEKSSGINGSRIFILILNPSPITSLCLGIISPVPSSKTGRIGTPASIASWKAPRLKNPIFLSTDLVPSGKIIAANITSIDVVHSWFVPEFGIKLDANPGRIKETLSVNLPRPRTLEMFSSRAFVEEAAVIRDSLHREAGAAEGAP